MKNISKNPRKKLIENHVKSSNTSNFLYHTHERWWLVVHRNSCCKYIKSATLSNPLPHYIIKTCLVSVIQNTCVKFSNIWKLCLNLHPRLWTIWKHLKKFNFKKSIIIVLVHHFISVIQNTCVKSSNIWKFVFKPSHWTECYKN